MRKIDYDNEKESYTGGTETHVAVDTQMKRVIANDSSAGDRQAFEEGFASASGVRPDTAASGGRIRHPEVKDSAQIDPVPESIENENSGLADN